MPSASSLLEPTIFHWLDGVIASPPGSATTPDISAPLDDDRTKPRRVKRSRSITTDMDSGVGGIIADDNDAALETPRPPKRRRNFDDGHHFSPPASPTKTESSASITSHKSGRLSPIKQIQALKDHERPVIFCDFDSLEGDGEQEGPDVAAMRTATQTLADGFGILDYDNADAFAASIAELPEMDRRRLQYAHAKDSCRSLYGSTPPFRRIADIVRAAWELNSGAGGAEDEWNTNVQYPLLKVALETCRHSKVLSIRSVKTARIDPPALCNNILPGRIIDYVVCLQPDPTISNAYRSLRPLAANTVKSWNHVTRLQDLPIAINIETKAPMKSWTDGKPQIGIWTDAWLRRCELLWADGRTPPPALHKDWPAIPVLISQGHEWHLLVVTKTSERLVFREQIMIGSTRNCFDALKVVAILHWLMDWAETVWRPWFLSLIADDDG